MFGRSLWLVLLTFVLLLGTYDRAQGYSSPQGVLCAVGQLDVVFTNGALAAPMATDDPGVLTGPARQLLPGHLGGGHGCCL